LVVDGAITAAQACRATELVEQALAFLFETLGSRAVAAQRGAVELAVEFVEPTAIRLLRTRVQYGCGAGVGETIGREDARRDVEPWVCEQGVQVAQAFGVGYPSLDTVEDERPHIAVSTECVVGRRRRRRLQSLEAFDNRRESALTGEHDGPGEL